MQCLPWQEWTYHACLIHTVLLCCASFVLAAMLCNCAVACLCLVLDAAAPFVACMLAAVQHSVWPAFVCDHLLQHCVCVHVAYCTCMLHLSLFLGKSCKLCMQSTFRSAHSGQHSTGQAHRALQQGTVSQGAPRYVPSQHSRLAIYQLLAYNSLCDVWIAFLKAELTFDSNSRLGCVCSCS